jgi:hypothetical protein
MTADELLRALLDEVSYVLKGPAHRAALAWRDHQDEQCRRASNAERCAVCGATYASHYIETYPPRRDGCSGFECCEDHDATGRACPLTKVSSEGSGLR